MQKIKKMFRFLMKEQEKNVIAQTTIEEQAPTFLIRTNEVFKRFFNNCSSFVYVITTCVILLCICYYITDYKRRLNLRRRRENLQRENERIPQRRRPGAIYRQHEIFRNALKTVHQYIGPNELQGSRGKSCTLRKTRSGRIYGSFTDEN